ncbi:MAG: flagellar protein FlaG [Lachnospiraceae bacterium]|nr:flagellar protein FlaG [Lachnospiraceae bacterium]
MEVATNYGVTRPEQGSSVTSVSPSPATQPKTEEVEKVASELNQTVSTVASLDAGEKEKREPSTEQIKKAVAEINKKASGTEAIFGIHDQTNRVTIKIVDKETKDVIKELPAEKTLDLIAKAWEMAGLLVDEKR